MSTFCGQFVSLERNGVRKLNVFKCFFKCYFLSKDNLQQQQQMMGMTSQTGTSHSSLATPPSTVQPVRQSSVAPPPTQRVKSQTSHQLSVSAAATPAPPAKTRPQSGNLLQSPESGYGGRQQGPRQLSVKDNTAPGLPHQQSSVRESGSPQGTTNQTTQQSPQQQQQSQQQHLLKPTISKQVIPLTFSTPMMFTLGSQFSLFLVVLSPCPFRLSVVSGCVSVRRLPLGAFVTFVTNF